MKYNTIQFIVYASGVGKKGFPSIAILALDNNVNSMPPGLNMVREKLPVIRRNQGSYLITLDQNADYKLTNFVELPSNIRLAKVRWKTKVPRLLIAQDKIEHEAGSAEKDIIYQWHPIMRAERNPIGYVRLVPSIDNKLVSLNQLRQQLPKSRKAPSEAVVESEIPLI